MQNANGKNVDELIGCEVDFEGKDGKASEIYIIKEAKTLGKDRLKSTLQSVDSALINFDANKAKSKKKVRLAVLIRGLQGYKSALM